MTRRFVSSLLSQLSATENRNLSALPGRRCTVIPDSPEGEGDGTNSDSKFTLRRVAAPVDDELIIELVPSRLWGSIKRRFQVVRGT